MFKLFRRTRTATVAPLTRETEQQILDSLRYHHASDQLMQLHLDRMQASMGGAMRAI